MIRIDPDQVPRELRDRDQWVAWRLEPPPKPGAKPRKVPINPATGKRADTTKASTWGSFEQTLDRAHRDNLAGVGFVFTEGDEYVGVDIDHCRDPETGKLDEEASCVVAELDTYTEVSPSGTGIHCVCRGKLPPGRRKKGRFEVYDSARYFTFTGRTVRGTPHQIAARHAELAVLHERIFGKPRATTPRSQRSRDCVSSTARGERSDGDSSARVTLCKDAEIPAEMIAELCALDADFARVWERRGPNDWSQSEYDLSIATRLLAVGMDEQAVVDALIQHRRDGGGEPKLRQDYYRRTLDKARSDQVNPAEEQEIADPAEDPYRDEDPSGRPGKQLSPRVLKLLETKPRLKAIYEGRGKTVKGPDGRDLDRSRTGYDFSFVYELIRLGTHDLKEVATALALRPDAAQTDPAYITRIVNEAWTRFQEIHGTKRRSLRAQVDFPVEKVLIFDTVPGRFELVIYGEQLTLTSEELRSRRRFATRFIDVLKRVPRLPPKQAEWEEVVNVLLAGGERVELPEDASDEGLLKEDILHAIEDLPVGEEAADLDRGCALLFEGEHRAFKATALRRRLLQDHPKLQPNDLARVLRELGYTSAPRFLAGTTVRTWCSV